MPNDVDFHGIGEALADALRTHLAGVGLTVKSVMFEPDAVQLTAFNTPMVTITLGEGNSQSRAGASYYDTFELLVEVACIDLSNWATAANARTAIFRQCRNYVRSNPRFHVDVNEAKLAGYEFERAIDTAEDTWYAAVARFQVLVGVYYDQ